MRSARLGASFSGVRVIESPKQPGSSEPLLSLRLLSSLLPESGSELEHRRTRPARQKRQHVAQVSPGFDVVELAARDERGSDRVPLGALIAPAEGPIRTTDDKSPLILPMSRFVLACAIAGTRASIVIKNSARKRRRQDDSREIDEEVAAEFEKCEI
jgi:hypothetical protein